MHTPRLSANGMNNTCLCLPSRSWYSFTDPGGMEGWVGSEHVWTTTERLSLRAVVNTTRRRCVVSESRFGVSFSHGTKRAVHLHCTHCFFCEHHILSPDGWRTVTMFTCRFRRGWVAIHLHGIVAFVSGRWCRPICICSVRKNADIFAHAADV